MNKTSGNILRFILCSSFLVLFFQTKVKSQDEFELVQSVPAETDLGNPEIARTSDVWLKMINEAKTSIDIETFYFANQMGEPLEEIMSALKSAAERNVKIRIIIDSSFYAGNDKSIDELNGIPNIEIKKIPFGNIAGGVMHAKYFIVDGENLFLGSQNMDWRALKHIHEIGARVKNKKLAETFSYIFENDWNLCDGIKPVTSEQNINFVNSSNPVVINQDGFGEIIIYPAFSPVKLNAESLNSEETELLKIISETRDSLLIQIYSYSPKAKNEKNYYDTIDNALREAASRGVKIKIIFPDWAIRESAIDFIKNLSVVNNIEIKFSTIPQFSGGFITYSRVEHCKYFISDNKISWISTSNWEWGYFNNSRNATLIIVNEKINSILAGEFMKDWNGPYTSPVDVRRKYEPVKRN